ncbi:hypothetical protein D3C72_1444660 [compost metagenome]
MDVEQATLIVAYEASAENAHESGQYHEFGIEGVDQFDQRGVEGLATFESLVIQGAGVDTRVPGALQAVGVGAVGNHRSDADRAVAGPRAVDQGLQVTAGAGEQHHDITGLRHQ